MSDRSIKSDSDLSNNKLASWFAGLMSAAVFLTAPSSFVQDAGADSTSKQAASVEVMDRSFLNTPLMTADGGQKSLAEYMQPDRWTLVMIWSVHCHVCKDETPVISDFFDAHKDSLATVVGLALDGDEARSQVADFGKSYDMRFPTLIGDLVPVSSAYMGLTQESLRGTPTFMLFNPDGVLQGINPGPLRPQAVLEFIKRKS